VQKSFAYERRLFAYERRLFAYEQKSFAYERRLFAYEQKSFAYELRLFAYEQKGFAYEHRLIAYEQKGFAYEHRLFAYEQKGFAYEHRLIAYEQKGFAYEHRLSDTIWFPFVIYENIPILTTMKRIASTGLIILGLFGHIAAQTVETDYFLDVTATHVPTDPDAHTLDAAMADVDNDGDLDVILALEAAPNRLYLNDGKGVLTWKKGVFTEASHDMEHIRVADFDNDGILDCIFVAEDDQNHEFYLGNGDGTFRDVSERLPAKSEGNGLDVGDVNGDGLPDVVVGNSGAAGQNFLWINNPDQPGHFIDCTATHLPRVNDQTQSIKLADLDGDGDLDMVVGNEVPPNRLLLNDGHGRFSEHSAQLNLHTLLHTREVLIFDVDGDDDQDIVFANLTSNGGQRDKDPRTRLLINDGTATFSDETESRLPNNEFSTYAAAPMDFDRDGHPDLLLSAMKIPPFEAMQVQAYRNDGHGNFTNVTASVIPETTVGRSWGIAIGDLNGDGLPDVFIGGWGSQARLLLAK